ncbi:MAG: DUF2809 domain-containing protein [Flavobacterium sp.]|nr:DUF2809 domain-containing protein [Flavobacterium sp.]
MIYFILRIFSPASRMSYCALISITTCFAIEFSQLYQQPWANELRATWIGRHILGSGFLWTDLIALAAGVFLGWLPDKTLNIQNRG